MNNRGISPLVATLLLIIFSVGLGAVVMSWGETYIEESAEFTRGVAELGGSCETLGLQVVHVQGEPQICRQDGQLRIIIENGPDREVSTVQANIIGASGVSTLQNILGNPLAPTAVTSSVVAYDATIGDILQVKLTPVLQAQTGREYCASPDLTFEEVNDC